MLMNDWPSWDYVLTLLLNYKKPTQKHVVADQVKLLIEQAKDEKVLLNFESIY